MNKEMIVNRLRSKIAKRAREIQELEGFRKIKKVNGYSTTWLDVDLYKLRVPQIEDKCTLGLIIRLQKENKKLRKLYDEKFDVKPQ